MLIRLTAKEPRPCSECGEMNLRLHLTVPGKAENAEICFDCLSLKLQKLVKSWEMNNERTTS